MKKKTKKKTKELNIKDFWWFHNTTCWLIKRENLVDFYLYLPTMRYIYKTAFGKWHGTTDPTPQILIPKEERPKLKNFKNENDAVKWLGGHK